MCRVTREAQWQKLNSESESEKSRRWRQAHPEAYARSNRNSILKRKYGITIEGYEKLLEAQNYVCAVCKKVEPRKGGRLAIDHCHATRKIRGLLCTKCNTAIGLLDDSPGLAAELLEYMKKHRQLNFSFPSQTSGSNTRGKRCK